MAGPSPVQVIVGYGDATALVRQRVLAFIESRWGSLSSYRDSDITKFVNAILPVVLGGQRQMASLTDAYLASLESIVLGTSVRPVGIPTRLVAEVRGIDPSEVYRRAGIRVWRSLANGEPLPKAVQSGLARALNLASTDLQLARTRTAQYALGRKDTVTGYRRVLSGREDCALCTKAASQRYRTGDLMPIHPGCDCAVAPIYGLSGRTVDPVSQADRLQPGDTVEPVDITIHEHGELGPLLAIAGQTFTELGDI